MNGCERIRNKELWNKVMTAMEASEYIKDKMVIGVSGFTPSGYPKAVPLALVERFKKDPQPLKVSLYSGASLGPELDGAWTDAGILSYRTPYQTNESLRNAINAGTVDYVDMHLSRSGHYMAGGAMAKVDIAIIEAVAITEQGHLVPAMSVGNSPIFIEQADKVIVEINLKKSLALEGMADIYGISSGCPIPLQSVEQRIGLPYMHCGADKIAAIVFTDAQDQTRPLTKPDHISEQISSNILAFLRSEVKAGRLPENLRPLQSGVGSVANAVLYGLCESEFANLSCYTEVVQDSMLDLLRSGKAKIASTTAISPSPEGLAAFDQEIDFFRDKIIMRPQAISNSPEIASRLGVIAMNTALEVDIYGNVNSTHVRGTHMINGIGGSGDFARNAAITIFSMASTAKKGDISAIVPMVSHVDHTEHDVMIIVTEQGYADLRGLSPRQRAKKIIDNCAHPDYRTLLLDYYERACRQTGGQTPHILDEALSWHVKFMESGTMKNN